MDERKIQNGETICRETGKRKKLRIAQFLLIPLLVSLIGGMLLFAVSFIPTPRIRDHALASAYQIQLEGWPRNYETYGGHIPFNRGLSPDSVALMTAYTLDRQHPENLLLKKVYSDPAVLGWYNRLVETVEGRETLTESYSRYFMGFRFPIRLMMVGTAYYGMRILSTAAMMFLLVLAAATTARRNSIWTVMALALTIGLIEPWAIANTLTYGTCIILLFLLLTVLNCAGLGLADEKTPLLFCLFGALTQYFDFYTFPLLVCALPLLVLLDRYRGNGALKHVGRLFLAWAFGWIFTWIVNLFAVTFFTKDNGVRDAMESVAFRFGIGRFRSEETSYSVRDAFRAVWEYLGLPSPAIVIPVLLLVVIGLYAFSRLRFGKNRKLLAYLAAGCLGPIWIAATAQPIIIHTSMQYRSISTLYLALFLYALEALGLSNGRSRLAGKLWKS